MSCGQQTMGNGDDSLEAGAGSRPFDVSDIAWLVGQGVRHLNTADKEGELAYRRVTELLRRYPNDALETVAGLFRQANLGDAPLRWSLLYVLGDSGDGSASEFLVRTASKPLPEAEQDQGCEGTRDAEMLVCTMAVHALQRIATRHQDVSEQILNIISARPALPILIEAVKVADELRLKERARGLLAKDDHWILDIRRAHTQELFADPERGEQRERGFTPPKRGALYTAPQVGCCTNKER